MFHIPVEVFAQILSDVDNPTLKNLRYCSRLIDEMVIPLLFEEVVVVPYYDSFEHIKALAHNPKIRKAVRCIRYDVSMLDLKFRAQFGFISQPEAARLDFLEFDYPGFGVYFDFLERLKIPAQFESAMYLKSNGKFVTDRRSDLNEITTLLAHFPGVMRLYATTRAHRRQILGIENIVLRPLPQYFRKWFRSHAWRPYANKPGPDSDVGPPARFFWHGGVSGISHRAFCILLAVHNHSHRRFTVDIECEPARVFGMRPSDAACKANWLRDGLRNIDVLKIRLDGENLPEDWRFEADCNLAHLLSHSQILTDLALEHVKVACTRMDVIQAIKAPNSVPPLRKLLLNKIMCSQQTLTLFLQSLSSTLRIFTLNNIELIDSERPPAKQSIMTMIKTMAQDLDLEEVSLSGRLRGSDEDIMALSAEPIRQIWSTRGVETSQVEVSWDIEGHWMSHVALSKLLMIPGPYVELKPYAASCLHDRICAFITHRGPYPEELVEFEALPEKPSSRHDVRPSLYGDSSWIMFRPKRLAIPWSPEDG